MGGGGSSYLTIYPFNYLTTFLCVLCVFVVNNLHSSMERSDVPSVVKNGRQGQSPPLDKIRGHNIIKPGGNSSAGERHLAKVNVAGSNPVSRSFYRRHSQVARHRSAKPSSPVRIRVPPYKKWRLDANN